jgi:hypothetical protein
MIFLLPPQRYSAGKTALHQTCTHTLECLSLVRFAHEFIACPFFAAFILLTSWNFHYGIPPMEKWWVSSSRSAGQPLCAGGDEAGQRLVCWPACMPLRPVVSRSVAKYCLA